MITNNGGRPQSLMALPLAASLRPTVSASSLSAFADELGFAKNKASPGSVGPLARIRPGSREGRRPGTQEGAVAPGQKSRMVLPEKRMRGKGGFILI